VGATAITEHEFVPPVPRPLGYLVLNVYWFALSYLWNSLGRIVLPVLIPKFVPADVQATALGVLSSVGLVVAVVVQPVAGALSDRSTARWGRRRPYLLVGTLGQLAGLTGILLAPSYAFLFASYLVLQFISNVGHGPYQGLIPDRVPPERWGTAAGVKQFLEIAGLIVTSLATAHFVARGQIDLALGLMMLLLFATTLITLAGVHEVPLAADQVPPGSAVSTALHTFAIDFRRYPDFVWLLINRLFVLLGINQISNFALYFLRDMVFHAAPDPMKAATETTGILLATIAVAVLFVAYPAGSVSDRIGRRPLVVLSGLLGTLGALLLVIARGRVLLIVGPLAVTDILLYGGVLGISLGMFLSAGWAWATDLVPRAEAGRYLGISNLATAGAGVVAGLLGGPLIDVLNTRQPGAGYPAFFLVAAGSYGLGTLLLSRVKG
jgi:MFS family permease